MSTIDPRPAVSRLSYVSRASAERQARYWNRVAPTPGYEAVAGDRDDSNRYPIIWREVPIVACSECGFIQGKHAVDCSVTPRNQPLDRVTGKPASIYTPPEDLLVTPSETPVWHVTYYVYGKPHTKDMTSTQIGSLIAMFEGLGSTGFDISAERI